MLAINNVSKTLKGKKVLKSIDLTIETGEFVLLKGHNGSGKTMLLRMLAGLIAPDEGSVEVGENTTFGVIIENPSFLLSETALYNLKFLASINRVIGEEEILHLLKRLHLYEERNKRVKTFSLGMKQRLALVQAMMEEPDVLLLDEPFNAIDDDNLEIIYEMLGDYQRSGKTVVIASHGDYRDKCPFTRVVTMSDGRIKGEERIPLCNG